MHRRVYVHLVNARPEHGGSYQYTCSLLDELCREPGATWVIVADKRAIDCLSRDAPEAMARAKVIVLPGRLKGALAQRLAELLILPAVVLLHPASVMWSPMSAAPPFLLRGNRYVLSLHDLDTGVDSSVAAKHQSRGVRRLRRAARRAGLVAVPTSAVASRLQNVLAVDTPTVVLGGGPSARSARDPASGEKSADPPYALCVASNHSNKGHHTLARALGRARLQVPSLTLVLAGGRHAGALDLPATYGASNWAACRDVGYVRDREEVRQLMTGARFVVVASNYEGFGLAGLDAVAVGAAVVTTAVGVAADYPELYAAVVEPLNAKALADRMVELWSKPPHLKDPAVSMAEAELSWQTASQRFLKAMQWI